MFSFLLLSAATLSFGQNVPAYVPTNGLVGWWPFTNNFNDQSINGYNGTATNVTFSNDRFGNPNSAATFPNGNTTSKILLGSQLNYTVFSISVWIKPTGQGTSGFHTVISQIDQFSNPLPAENNFTMQQSIPDPNYKMDCGYGGNNSWQGGGSFGNGSASLNNWHHLLVTFNGQTSKTYYNSVLVDSAIVINYYNPISILALGDRHLAPNYEFNFWGLIDDIGIWNRVLTQQEVTALYNASNCANNTAITPQTNSLSTGNTATFTASTSDPNPIYVWQSDLGQGYQILNNFGNYSGASSATLNISNVQLSEHNQPIRVITTSGNCIDTSNVAVINILDTCIVTVYDTLLTTVTDTLIINTIISGVNPPNNSNTIQLYPNPASTHLTINYGNFALMNGYQLRIVNALSQQIYQTAI